MTKKKMVIFASAAAPMPSPSTMPSKPARSMRKSRPWSAISRAHRSWTALRNGAYRSFWPTANPSTRKRSLKNYILDAIEPYQADIICLAGFMRLLSGDFISHYEHKMLNIHPALLPSFRGLHAQRQAIEAGVKIAGCTVHFVVPDMDAGPIILQSAVPVYEDDTEDTLAARILTKEHPTYIKAAALFCDDKLTVRGNVVMGTQE